MSAAHRPDFDEAYDFIRRKNQRRAKPAKEPTTQARVLAAVQACLAEGVRLDSETIRLHSDGLTPNAIRAAYTRLHRNGLVPNREKVPPSEPKAAEPCSRCHTTTGYQSPGKRMPERRNFEGYPGKLCRACYATLDRERNKQNKSLRLFDKESYDVLEEHLQKIRDDRGATLVCMTDYDATASRWTDGLAAEREVVAEQAAKLLMLRSKGLDGVRETARVVAARCVVEHRARWRRLREPWGYCVLHYA